MRATTSKEQQQGAIISLKARFKKRLAAKVYYKAHLMHWPY